MNTVLYIFRRTSTLLASIVFSIIAVFGQKPDIKSIDKVSGSMEQLVTFQGAYFGTNVNNIAVTFGAARGTVLLATDQLLVASIPSGTTYNTIGVTNLTNGLSAYTNSQFLLNFGGTAGFDPAKLQGQFDFPGGAPVKEGLYDLCMCDFDGDKKVDVATANDNTSFINIFPNNSTVGTVAFPSKIALNIASKSLHVKCGDLNGDGKPDLVATEPGATDKVFVLKNNSTGTGSFAFSAPLTITLPGRRPHRIEIADLDLDGKPEVILSSRGNNSITVLVNQSTLASISFSPLAPISIVIPGAASTDGLAVEDLNGDKLPEIVTGQYQTNSDIYIISNNSSPGSVAAGAIRTLTVGQAIKNIRVGDLDGDRKPDIAYSKLASSEVGLFRNQSTSVINFTAMPGILVEDGPWGIDLGDLDGDGKADMVIGSIRKKSITILNNTSVSGSFTFDRYVQPVTYINRHINVCDVDTDGKPDIVFTSIDDNILNVVASKVSVFRNTTCMIPEVTPKGPLSACDGLGLQLVATKGGGVTYEWTNTTTSTNTPGTNLFSPTVTGDYFVTAISEGGNCKEVSNTVKVTIAPGTAGDPAPVNNGPVCIGQTLNLRISNDLGAGYTYLWTGPDNYSSTGINPAPVANFQAKNAGIYYVDVRTSSGCIARREATLVQAVDLPDFNVSFTGSAFICQPDFKTLSVYPSVAGFTYQWFEKTTGLIAGATGATLLRNTSGEYYYQATSSNPGCPVSTSKSAILTVVVPPVPAFELPATACRGQEVAFVNKSTSDPQTTASYLWNFGDGFTSTDQNPTHIYATASTFTVSLVVSYPSNACPVTVSKSITITDAPAVSITSSTNKFELCSGASLVLGVSGTFSYYLWSTGATTPTITVSDAADYSVEVTATNGCELKAIQAVTALPAPTVSVTATPEQINEGESSQLSASGLLNYSWIPSESLSAPDQAEPIATPLTSTTYTVTGTDGNGCEGTATIDVIVKGESIVSKLEPSNFFSPNGDAVGEYWVIGKIEDYPQCTVTIYDDKGVKVYDSKPYQNDWAGTYNGGKRLPDGVYYFIIRCDGEENVPRTGSITLLR